MKKLCLLPCLLLCWFACGPRAEECTTFGPLRLSDSLDHALRAVKSDSQFVLLQVLDSSEASQAFLQRLDSFPCLRYKLHNGFAGHYRVNIHRAVKRSAAYVYKEFASDHGLKAPFFILLGRSDTVFSFTEIFDPQWSRDSTSAADSALAFMLREQANPQLRNDITFLHTREKEKQLTPKYYAWIRSISASGTIAETREKTLILRIEIRNPDRFRIVAPGTDQRSYLAPLRLEWEGDSLRPGPVQWLNEAQSFRDPFLQKNYLAYTDSLITGEALLPYAREVLPETLEGHLIFSVYVTSRKVAVNSVDLPLPVSVRAAPEAVAGAPLTRTSE